MPKVAKKSVKEWSAGGAGRKAIALREAQGLSVNPNLSVPHLPMTEQRKQKFLQLLAETGNINQAATLNDGGLHTSRSYRRLQSQDPAFARLMQDAIEGYAARVNHEVNRAAGLTDDAEMIPLVSAGECIKDPKTGEPVYVRKYSEKILLSLARSTNAALRDSKTVVNIDGTPAHDPVNNPRIIIELADLHRLDLTDQAALISLAKKIYQNRVEEWSGPEMKTISNEIAGEFTEEFEEDNPYDI